MDSSGGAVAGAEMSATGVETGSVYKAGSTSTGAYQISDMQVGSYNLTATAKGFKVSENKGVVVQINTTSSLDITLQPGDVKETLTVFGMPPRFKRRGGDIGTVVSQKQIQQLPLSIAASGQSFLRSPEAFVFITPGTAGPGPTAITARQEPLRRSSREAKTSARK